jgi:hypothetical protein
MSKCCDGGCANEPKVADCDGRWEGSGFLNHQNKPTVVGLRLTAAAAVLAESLNHQNKPTVVVPEVIKDDGGQLGRDNQSGALHAVTRAALIAAKTCLAQVGMGVPGPNMPAAPVW